ncbi:hypothetical protein PR202_ga30894 [Eleusine coracana subsp. coracana]|uniref:Uncharacterized protein n=1 Tax=Eleusine coracana subsp. coracana TaxID=191504 RepID=A0AAV5DPZ7_ELECO|nr:hypothetical protein QOZ80_8AG0615320 [Eleusine coracana subsp. coracana]GJN12603.1 hypothetical protein PR202_ga30894 [Eleusine coracana subsp. coracana]
MTHSTTSSSSKPPTDDESALPEKKVVLAAAAADVCLAAVCLAGAALLTWWALAFHPSYGQLWMVPVGLVLACTPVVVCVALHFSPAADQSGKEAGSGAGAGAPPQLSAVVVVVGK